MKFKPNTRYHIIDEENQTKFQKECFKQGIYWASGKQEILYNPSLWFYINGNTLTRGAYDDGSCISPEYSLCQFPGEDNHLKLERVVVQAYGYNLPTLTEKQVKWLHSVMQNPLWGQEPEDEDWDEKQIRKFFFEVTNIKEIGSDN